MAHTKGTQIATTTTRRFFHLVQASIAALCFHCMVFAASRLGPSTVAPQVLRLFPGAHTGGHATRLHAVLQESAPTDNDVMTRKLAEAQEVIRTAQRNLEALQAELGDQAMFAEPVDRGLIIEVLSMFTPTASVAIRPLLDKTFSKVVPALQDCSSLCALVTGMTIARLPHEPAWRAVGDATVRLCSAGRASAMQLVELAWAFATAGERRPDLFASLRASMAGHSGELAEDHRRLFAWACAEVGEHAVELFGEPTVQADVAASRRVLQALGGLARSTSSVEVLLADLPVVAVHDVVSYADGAELVRLADAGGLWRSSSRRGARDAGGVDALRTSSSAVLSAPEYRAHPIAEAIRTWAASTLDIPLGYVEALQLVRYTRGQQYGPHVDWGRSQDASLWLGGQRTATALIYLNSLQEGCGGETVFTHLGLRVSPQAGTAVLWPNVDSNGMPQPLTEHQAMPVLCDETKYAVNVWVRGQELPNYNAPRA